MSNRLVSSIQKLTHFIDFSQKTGKQDEEEGEFALVDSKLLSKSKVLSRRGIFLNKLAQKTRQQQPLTTSTNANNAKPLQP